jgi:Cys-tRNA(Pro)/Cys-tRNA(Cys) deacylase
MPTINNVTRMLDAKKVPYQAFELPAEKLGAMTTARILGVPPEQVYKSIVILKEKSGKAILAVIPGPNEVDTKALAAALGEKKVHVSTQREAEQLTGLQTGGISPLALINRGFQVFLDQAATGFHEIHISGGQRGLNLRLKVTDLVKLTHARLAVISAPAVGDAADKENS